MANQYGKTIALSSRNIDTPSSLVVFEYFTSLFLTGNFFFTSLNRLLSRMSELTNRNNIPSLLKTHHIRTFASAITNKRRRDRYGVSRSAYRNYIDPPYFDKGSSLYMNHYSAEDHEDLAKVILGLRHKWVLSYDDVPEIVKIYGDIVPQRFTLKYSSYERKIGKELFFFSDNLNSDLCGCNSKAVTGLDSGDSICIE